MLCVSVCDPVSLHTPVNSSSFLAAQGLWTASHTCVLLDGSPEGRASGQNHLILWVFYTDNYILQRMTIFFSLLFERLVSVFLLLTIVLAETSSKMLRDMKIMSTVSFFPDVNEKCFCCFTIKYGHHFRYLLDAF